MPYIEIREPEGSVVEVVASTSEDILTGLSDRPGADMTSRLLLALTALYVQRPTHTAEEQQQYVELALRLMDKVDAATRTAVAAIQQRQPDGPAEVFEHLDGTQVSPGGNPKSDPHSTRDQNAAHGQHSLRGEHVVGGQGVSMPSPPEAAPAVRQPATPEFGEIFFAASPAERRCLVSLIAPGGGDEIQASAEVGGRLHGVLDVAVLQGQIGEFTREFERVIDIPKSLCERIVNDPSGEPMVVAAKATGVPIAILQRILLLVNPEVSHSVQRVYDLTELYQGLDHGAARTLLASWRSQAKPSDAIQEAETAARDRKPGGLCDTSVASLRSRFGALTERLQAQAVNARPGPGSVAQRGLRSR